MQLLCIVVGGSQDKDSRLEIGAEGGFYYNLCSVMVTRSTERDSQEPGASANSFHGTVLNV